MYGIGVHYGIWCITSSSTAATALLQPGTPTTLRLLFRIALAGGGITGVADMLVGEGVRYGWLVPYPVGFSRAQADSAFRGLSARAALHREGPHVP